MFNYTCQLLPLSPLVWNLDAKGLWGSVSALKHTECDCKVMTLQQLIEVMQFYFVVTCHIAVMLWNICPTCANIIILFLHGKYMLTLLETLLNLVYILQRGQLWTFKVAFNFASLFNEYYEKNKNSVQLLMHWLLMYLWNSLYFIWFGFHVCVWVLDWRVGWRLLMVLGAMLSWACSVVVLFVKVRFWFVFCLLSQLWSYPVFNLVF